jgi:hypothetical protein
MEKLIELYKQILDYAGMEADSDGLISYGCYLEPEPATIGNARLVLPLRKFLKDPDPTKRIVFNPLAENIVEGESKVVQKLRHILNVRINYTFGAVANAILMMAASPELQKKLDSDQVKMLLPLKDVDTKTTLAFTNLMKAAVSRKDVPLAAERVFVFSYLRKGGTINGQRYSRAGIIRFPMLEDLKKAEKELYGVKLRPKDVAAFKALMEVILGKDPEDKFSRGSDSLIAPCLEALMISTMGVASRLNDFLDSEFGEVIEDVEELIFNGEWVTAFENLEAYRALICMVPMQAGSESSEEAKVTQPAPAPAQPVQQTAYPTQAPVAAPVVPATAIPVPPSRPQSRPASEDRVSYKELMARAHHQQQQQFPQQMAQVPQQPQYVMVPVNSLQQPQAIQQPAYSNPFQPAYPPQYQAAPQYNPHYGRGSGLAPAQNQAYPTGAPVSGGYGNGGIFRI